MNADPIPNLDSTLSPATPADWRPGMMGPHHEDVVDRGIVCWKSERGPAWEFYCPGVMHFTNEVMTGTPPGSKMVYALYQCNTCGSISGLVSDMRSE